MSLGAIHKEQHVARLEGGVDDETHVVITGANAGRHPILCFVAAWNTGEAPIVVGDVAELPGDSHGFAEAATVLVDIGATRIQRFVGIVQRMA